MQSARYKGAVRGALTCYEEIGVEMMRDIQGFPKDHKLPYWTMMGKKRAYGNAVPIPMAEYLAGLVRFSAGTQSVSSQEDQNVSGRPARNVSVSGPKTANVSEIRNETLWSIEGKRCECGCGRVLMGRQRRYSSGACRLRGFKERERLRLKESR